MSEGKTLFKTKANQILQSSPQSIKEFLQTPSKHQVEKQKAHLHPCANTQNHTHPELPAPPKRTVRIHVNIRQDLSDKMLNLVYKRKKEQTTLKKDATQRAIIEEALEMFFTGFDSTK